MRIVITSGIFPPDIGGPATHASHLAAALRDRGHEVTVLTLTDERRTVRQPGLVRHPRSWPWPLRNAAAWCWLIRNRRAYDAIYATGLDLPAVAAGLVTRRPVVLKVVGDFAWERARRQGLTTSSFADFQSDAGGASRVRAMRRLRRWTASRATAVVTPSQFLQDQVETWTTGKQDIFVVPNGVPANPYRSGGDIAAGDTDQDDLRALYIGRLIDDKRVDVLLEAVATAPGVSLDIVGDGPARSGLETLCSRLELNHRVNFLGPLSWDATMRALADSDVLVNASAHEGLPHVAVEALVSGVPVACSAVGGVAEVVTHEANGVLVDQPTPAAFATVLSRMHGDRRWLASLSRTAGETGTQWQFETCAQSVEALLSEVSARRWRPRAVYVGRATPLPPSAELKRKLAIHSRHIRHFSVTTGAPGHWKVSGTHLVVLPSLRPPLLGGLAFYVLAPFVAVPLAAGRRSAIVCQSPYEALGVILVSRLVPRGVRPAVQVELHGDWRTASRLYGSPARSLLGPACDWMAGWALRRADRVRAVSGSLVDQARDAGYAGPVDRHFTFSDFSRFLQRPVIPPPARRRAVFIGVLERYKAIDLLIDAWPHVLLRVPDAELLVVGQGTLGHELQRRVKARDVKNVDFRAPVGQDEVADLLDSATCLVLPSRSEGLPRVVMEAMSRGRAVVASDVGGMRELVVDRVTGRLVPPEDVLALTDALSDVLSDVDLARSMGLAGRRRAEERDPAAEYEAGITRLAAWIGER